VLPSFFVTDLHGRPHRYEKLAEAIAADKPRLVLIGGDLLIHDFAPQKEAFLANYLLPLFERLRAQLAETYPAIFLILGNDDARSVETLMMEGEAAGLWFYAHNRCFDFEGFSIYGYACVPPTPFLLKDWERYDVSRFVDPGAVSPEEGKRTVPVSEMDIQYGTIQNDLEVLTHDQDLSRAVFLFHSPPYHTNLDRAALDGKMVDYVPLDVHVGSIAIRRFIEQRQPLLTLHGHIHESTRLTGTWREQIGQTLSINAAHDGPELALIRFDLENPASATRELL
jgi:Icc-related predicted phosphoesterase